MKAAILVCALLCASAASAASIKWTGYAKNNQWNSAVNWYPAQVPGPNDDVTINKGDVQVTTSVAIQSLAMGNSFSDTANITLYKDFYVSNTFTVEGNGNLIVQAGTDTITGTFNIAGNFYFLGGVLAGSWTTSSMGKAHMGGAGEKGFSGCSFVSGGSLTISGVLALNQSSVFTVNNGAAVSGNVNIQNQDGTASKFDASPSKFSYSGPGLLSVQCPAAFGDVDFTADVSVFSKTDFTKAIAIGSGITLTTMGDLAVVNMSSGVTGAGKLIGQGNLLTLGGVNMTGSLSVAGGNVSFGAAGNSVATFTINGGTARLANSISCTQLNINGGEFAKDAGSITAVNANVETNGFDWNGAVSISGTGTFAPSLIAFGTAGSLTLGADSKSTLSGTFTLTGQPNGRGVTNNGAMDITGTLSTTNVNVEGSGSMTVAQEISINVATLTQKSITLAKGGIISGAHSFFTLGAVSAPTSVAVAIGDYTFTCPKECDNVSTPNKKSQPTNNVKISGN